MSMSVPRHSWHWRRLAKAGSEGTRPTGLYTECKPDFQVGWSGYSAPACSIGNHAGISAALCPSIPTGFLAC